MTDLYGADLERILRDILRRLDRIETAQGIKKAVNLPAPEFPSTTTPQYPQSFNSPATIIDPPTADNYNTLRADIVNQTFTPLRDVINKCAAIGLWPAP